MLHEREASGVDSSEMVARGVERAIATRRSVRAFSSRPVPADVVASIARTAARDDAVDMRTWNVWVLERAAILRVRNAIHATKIRDAAQRHRAGPSGGRDLYSALGIAEDLRTHPAPPHGRCNFFEAPVGLLVTSNRLLDNASSIELGSFVQNVLLLAAGRGLAGCVQTAFSPAVDAIHPALGIGYDQSLVCTVALGYEDRALPPRTDHREAAASDTWLNVVR